MKRILLVLFMSGCNFSHVNGGSRPMDPDRIIFMDVAQHVFLNNCLSCHHSGKTINGKLMLDLMIYNEVKTYVIPRQPMKSKLFKVVYADLMPPDGKNPTTDDQKEILGNWIAQGAIEK